ncbi:FecR family protein [Chitinophaga rupis]|uniref:FecR family protein n=1 Tax=Chitinophaga rupis TaxID=573321 RepID=A0A1H7RWE0_9BACT|nr:FecR domain-containing protein [Chitinophaga rupis]SEL64573.1 FecR family protein [Chitinophaga rupis]
MKNIKDLHIEAMKLAKIADEYLLSHQEALFVKFTSDAFMLENEAAQALIDELDKEPTRGVLCRSAATLAYNIGLFQEAKEIIKVGLSGRPFPEIRLELEELQTKVETAIKENYSAEKVINDLKAILSNSSTITQKKDNEQKPQQREVKSEHGIPEAASQFDFKFEYNAVVERKKYARRIGIVRVAAAVLMLIISGILGINYVLPTLDKESTMLVSYGGSRKDSAIRTLVVPRGQEDNVSLPDGSTIHINSDSRMEVQFTKSNRKVDFKGEAYFNVSPDRRPFIITTSYITIEVLGTAFNVNTYDSGVIKISLVQGKIRFKALNKDVIVKAGEELAYGPGGAFELGRWTVNAAAWQQGIYPFRNENLKSIAAMLERLFDTRIVIDDERLLDKNFTGMIDRSIGFKCNIDNMRGLIKFDYYLSGDTLHITSR